jgi:alkanesulfonate monooxygenase SsuD/methylene tetrahydromethanopterin reductase-like flavin-dependent oxidoreductase (luciferase family)
MSGGVMTHPLRLGIKLSQDASIDSYKAVWKIADEARFDHCWAMDHLASIGGVGDDRPIFDGWELLAGMATSTTHVRLGLLVTGMTYRNPALLAKIATTVDHLSNGRLEFGIGAAWAANEHEMYDISGLDHRVGLFSEGLQVIKSLWTQERTNFDGRYYRMRDAVAVPKPVQNPYPPIWVGSGGPRMLRLTARHADVWNASGNDARELQGAVTASQQLDDACTTIGRDPKEIRRSAQLPVGEDTAEIIDRVHRYHEAGVTEIILMLTGGSMSSNADPVQTASRLAENVLPELRR